MKDREKHFTGSTLMEIFDELDEIAMVLDNGLSMLAVLEGTEGKDIDSKDMSRALSILYDHLYGPSMDLHSLVQVGMDLLACPRVKTF